MKKLLIGIIALVIASFTLVGCTDDTPNMSQEDLRKLDLLESYQQFDDYIIIGEDTTEEIYSALADKYGEDVAEDIFSIIYSNGYKLGMSVDY